MELYIQNPHVYFYFSLTSFKETTYLKTHGTLQTNSTFVLFVLNKYTITHLSADFEATKTWPNRMREPGGVVCPLCQCVRQVFASAPRQLFSSVAHAQQGGVIWHFFQFLKTGTGIFLEVQCQKIVELGHARTRVARSH